MALREAQHTKNIKPEASTIRVELTSDRRATASTKPETRTHHGAGGRVLVVVKDQLTLSEWHSGIYMQAPRHS